MAKPLKILVSGDVEGKFNTLFKRVETIQGKNGNFDLLLCVGDFFGTDMSTWAPYKSGALKVPISTLILGPTKSELGIYYSGADGVDLSEGVTYLGKKGKFTESSGLQIAYLSGLESCDGRGEECSFTVTDASALTAPVLNDTGYKGIDIFITSQWPKDVEKYAPASTKKEGTFPSSACVAEVARVLKPRYHFSGLEGVFYERRPYRNHQVLLESPRTVTRFVGLAKAGNKEKLKYLYAFNIVPLAKMEASELVKQPEDVTECPYTASSVLDKKQVEEGQQFFYDMKAGPPMRGKKRGHRGGGRGGERGRGGREGGEGRGGKEGNEEFKHREYQEKKPRRDTQPAGPCWFCLGSSEVEKHLVVSVSDKAYLALAKGGLVPDHVLILPVHHHQSLVSCPDDVRQQIDKYKSCLRKMFKSQEKGVVFFERNFITQHLQIQAVPVPHDSIIDVKDTFISCAESENIELAEIPKHSDLKQIVPDGQPYFYAEMPTGEKCLHRILKHFPLQFGREALCEPAILNMPERVDWRNCKLDQLEEKEMAASFKTDFKSFDFNFAQ